MTVTGAVPSHGEGGARGHTIFADDFGTASRGPRSINLIDRPPPEGLGYATDVPSGFSLKNWIVADIEGDSPRRAFWVIPQRANGFVDDHAEQAGRSRDSIAFAGVPVPPDTTRYTIEFLQQANDNDYIGFVVGASEPVLMHDGIEFGYERQLPGTDRTVPDVHYRGPWGEGRIAGQANLHRWVWHRIEVEDGHLRWSQDGNVLLAGAVNGLRPGGWFGIRHKYERGTRYREFRIHVPNAAELQSARGANSSTPPAQGSRALPPEASVDGRWEEFLAKADTYVSRAGDEMPAGEGDGSARAVEEAVVSALAYWFAGDRRHGERAKELALALIHRPSWRTSSSSEAGPDRRIAEATLVCALALAWCVDLFDPEQRAFVEWKVVELGLRPYVAGVELSRERWHAGEQGGLASLCHGSAGIAAWILHESYPEARRAYDHARRNFPAVVDSSAGESFPAGAFADHLVLLGLESGEGRLFSDGLSADWFLWRAP